MDGNPRKVEIRKKLVQPTDSTMNPEGEDRTVLAKPIIEDNKAYWVPVYFLLHKADRYATKAADPSPPEKFSPATVKNKYETSAPTEFNKTYNKFEIT